MRFIVGYHERSCTIASDRTSTEAWTATFGDFAVAMIITIHHADSLPAYGPGPETPCSYVLIDLDCFTTDIRRRVNEIMQVNVSARDLIITIFSASFGTRYAI